MVFEHFAAIKIMSSLFTNNTRPGDVMGFPRGFVLVREAVQVDGNLIHILAGLCRAIIRDN